jgi:hypothetical protein
MSLHPNSRAKQGDARMAKRGRFSFAVLMLLVLICITSWCQQLPHANDQPPSFFVVVPGATEIKQSVFQGKD